MHNKKNNDIYVVAGGAGFIGYSVCRKVLLEGANVIIIDDLSTGNGNNVTELMLEFGISKIIFINSNICSITSDILLEKTKLFNLDRQRNFNIKEKGVKFVLNFASPASPKDYVKKSLAIHTLETGSIGTQKLLEIAKEFNSTFLMASTSEIYGDPEQHPQKESYWGNVNTIGERSVYDEAKRYSESITTAYNKYHGVDTRIVRIFNTYGKKMRENDGRAIPNFIYQCQNNRDIEIYGDGSQTRSFCYIDDLVDGVFKLINYKDEKYKHEPFNIGNDTEYTIKELAISVKKIMNSTSNIIFKNLPQDDPKLRKPDLSKARKLLGYNPKVSLSEGLKKTIYSDGTNSF